MVPTCIHWFAWDQKSSWKIVDYHSMKSKHTQAQLTKLGKEKAKIRTFRDSRRNKRITVSKEKSIWALKLTIPTRSRPLSCGVNMVQTNKQKGLTCKLKPSHSAPPHPPPHLNPRSLRTFLAGHSEEETSSFPFLKSLHSRVVYWNPRCLAGSGGWSFSEANDTIGGHVWWVAGSA